MDYKELINQSKEQLTIELSRLREELHAFAVKVRMNEAKDTHKLRNLRKDIARILTALRSKQA